MHISQMLEQASLEEPGKEKKDEVEVFLSNPTLIQSMSKSLACIYEGGGGGIRSDHSKIDIVAHSQREKQSLLAMLFSTSKSCF